MKIAVKFAENDQRFAPQFVEVNNVSDGGYESGYADGYEIGYEKGSAGCVTTISGVDLHVKSADTPNAYLIGSSIKTYKGWRLTDYIPVEDGKYYLAYAQSAIDAKYCSKFGASKNFISALAGTINCTDKNLPVFLTGFDGYFRFSGQANQIEKLEFYEVVNFRWEVAE